MQRDWGTEEQPDEVEELTEKVEQRLEKRKAEQEKAQRESNPYNQQADAVWGRAQALPEEERKEVYDKLSTGQLEYAKKVVDEAEEKQKADLDYRYARDRFLKNPQDKRVISDLAKARARAGKV